MENSEILHLISTASGNENLYHHLVSQINALINTDYTQLIQLLYKVDVSEKKLKDTLRNHPDTDAAVLITDLILQRQAEKKASFLNAVNNDNIPEEERW